MAVTNTYTSAKVRVEIIKLQFRIALKRTALISEDSLESIEKGIDQMWIKKLTIYALDNKNLCRGQLELTIDWNEFNTQKASGNGKIYIDDNLWKNDTSIELDELIRFFNKFVKSKFLKTDWTVSYTSLLSREVINSKLGFVNAKPMKWAQGQSITEEISIEELPELKLGLKLID